MAFGTLEVDNLTTSTQTLVLDNLAVKASPTFTGNVTINAQGDLRLADSDSSNYVAFQAGGTIGSNYTIEFPTTVGATGKVLKSTVSGQVATLTWETDSATDSSKLPLDGSGVMTGSLKFEGSTADDYETILTTQDATGSDKTITLPNLTGTVSLVGATETLTNKSLTAPTITGAADLSGAALVGASPLTFEGATADAYELILAVTDITSSDKTITLPNATGTVSLVSATETLTNKSLTAPTITGAADLTGAALTGASPLVFEGSTANAHELTLAVPDVTADKTVTLPNETTTLAGLAVAQTYTKPQRSDVSDVNYAATVTLDLDSAQNFAIGTLTGNITLANPDNLDADSIGQSGVIYFVQDGTGGRTWSPGTEWHLRGGAGDLSTAGGAVDALVYTVRSATSIVCDLILDCKTKS